ncbi:MAG: SDR family NAD(P)-dependent oxidoreductase, partial [Halioglobus sp.]|nr:SDR family NAD(P)-dependent oxidoreductase [Halioglobus sp.]
MLDFSGEVVWVTGSASGIGCAVAREFAKCGADIVVHGLNQREASEALGDEIQAIGRSTLILDGDLTVSDIVDTMVQQIGRKFGRLSVLVNCAGGSPIKAMLGDLSEADWDFLVDLNLKSVFLATRAALPLLRAGDRKSCIVNVSSHATRSGGIPGGIGYTAAKGGVD